MAEAQLLNTELATQYASQVASDLERNATEQARISAELEALQEQLRGLEQDHTVLINVQQALAGANFVAPVAPTLPSQTSATSPRSKPTKAAPASTKKSTPKRVHAKSTTAKASKATTEAVTRPGLVDLVRSHLENMTEPRSAAEITTALVQAHPDRAIKTTVVRTTVENLVARSLAQRTKQGTSVFYTATAPVSSQEAAASNI
ncbi:hypothetical protein ACIBAC_40755 [Streptomyces sp. NPDC051362]|uniref:hypothetical protein n=1 Tax=Streptomyces sp. NPDC051362 TaxID=3365651 RepID=UPI0037A33555